MYKYDYTRESVDDFYSFYSTINYVKRNKTFHSSDDEIIELYLGTVADRFNGFDNIEDNVSYTIFMNPYFNCPAAGDYSIVNNVDDFEYVYDFYKIGVMN
jgi:hypothetical protein